MNRNQYDEMMEHKKSVQQMKVLTIFGCLGTVLIGLIVTVIGAWLLWNYIWTVEVEEVQVSHSPNQENVITVYQVNEFPDPTLTIEYDDKEIRKTKIPSKIIIEWENDVEAQIYLYGIGEDPDIESVQFD